MSVFNQVEGFVKKNKRLVAAGGLGGAFLLLKGKGGGGGAAVIDGSQAAILPVATSPNESIDNTDNSFPSDDSTSLNPQPEPEPEPEPHDSLDPSSPEPQAEPEPNDSPATAPATAAAAAAPSGISIAGKSFPGATGRQQVGAASNAYGKYTIWLVSYPSKSERWYHYYADEHGKAKDKWTGPHNSTGNSAPVSHTPAPAPSPAPRPVSSSPQPTTSQPAHSAPVPAPKEAPHMGANIFYNSDRNLRYIIQKHDNKKNYRHYESRLNKGDWGSGGVIPA